MVDYSSALWIPNGNYFPSREGEQARYIILHGTAGGSSAQETASYFQGTQGTANPVSSHYIIGQDGTVVQCVSEADGAWGNGIISGPAGTSGDGIHHDSWWDSGINPNDLTISIEHVKPSTDNSDTLTPAQQAASFALVKDICQRRQIPARQADSSGGITGHFSIDPVNRSGCPGPYPWAALWDHLGGNAMGVPAGWSDDGQTLTAPNKVQVIQGFRQWVLTHNWDPGDVPRLAAMGLDPVEQGNPALGPGTAQPFNTKILVWTAKEGVYEMYAGKEWIALYQVWDKALQGLHAAQSQITQLQAQIVSLEAQLTQAQNPAVKDYLSRLSQAYNLASQIAQIVRIPS